MAGNPREPSQSLSLKEQEGRGICGTQRETLYGEGIREKNKANPSTSSPITYPHSLSKVREGREEGDYGRSASGGAEQEERGEKWIWRDKQKVSCIASVRKKP